MVFWRGGFFYTFTKKKKGEKRSQYDFKYNFHLFNSRKDFLINSCSSNVDSVTVIK